MIHDNSNFTFNLYGRFYNKTNVCNDQYIGNFVYNSANQNNNFNLQCKASIKHNCQYQPRNDIVYNNFQKSNNPSIAIVLESPHVDEFLINGQSFTTAPAWGRTGSVFDKNFIPLLGSNINNPLLGLQQGTTYDVYFANAIRYQTSLGIQPIIPELRDYIFIDLWNNLEFEQDFIDRMQILQPDIIINAVTKNLKDMVQNTINSILPQANKARASEHPLKWSSNTFLY